MEIKNPQVIETCGFEVEPKIGFELTTHALQIRGVCDFLRSSRALLNRLFEEMY